jgi:hypothetical protein
MAVGKCVRNEKIKLQPRGDSESKADSELYCVSAAAQARSCVPAVEAQQHFIKSAAENLLYNGIKSACCGIMSEELELSFPDAGINIKVRAVCALLAFDEKFQL